MLIPQGGKKFFSVLFFFFLIECLSFAQYPEVLIDENGRTRNLNAIPIKSVVHELRKMSIRDLESQSEILVTKGMTVQKLGDLFKVGDYEINRLFVKTLFRTNPDKLAEVVFYLREDPYLRNEVVFNSTDKMEGYFASKLLESLSYYEAMTICSRIKQWSEVFAQNLAIRLKDKSMHRESKKLDERVYRSAPLFEAYTDEEIELSTERSNGYSRYLIREGEIALVNAEDDSHIYAVRDRSSSVVSMFYYPKQKIGAVAVLAVDSDVSLSMHKVVNALRVSGYEPSAAKVSILGGVTGPSNGLISEIYHWLEPEHIESPIRLHILNDKPEEAEEFVLFLDTGKIYRRKSSKRYRTNPRKAGSAEVPQLIASPSFESLVPRDFIRISNHSGVELNDLRPYLESDGETLKVSNLVHLSDSALRLVFDFLPGQTEFSRLDALNVLMLLPTADMARVFAQKFERTENKKFYLETLAIKDKELFGRVGYELLTIVKEGGVLPQDVLDAFPEIMDQAKEGEVRTEVVRPPVWAPTPANDSRYVKRLSSRDVLLYKSAIDPFKVKARIRENHVLIWTRASDFRDLTGFFVLFDLSRTSSAKALEIWRKIAGPDVTSRSNSILILMGKNSGPAARARYQGLITRLRSIERVTEFRAQEMESANQRVLFDTSTSVLTRLLPKTFLWTWPMLPSGTMLRKLDEFYVSPVAKTRKSSFYAECMRLLTSFRGK